MTPGAVLLLTPNFENNSLGRTYCLWELAKEAGRPVRVRGVRGERIWEPLADSEFAADCVLPGPGDERQRELALLPDVAWAEVVVAVKPLPSSFGVGRRLAEQVGRPLVVDIDDPDLEVRTEWLPRWERTARWLLKPAHRELGRLRRNLRGVPTTVSNPTLAVRYPGLIVPHVRRLPAEVRPTTSSTPVVRFVGSVREHKGLEQLRAAVGALADKGLRLEVTAPAPSDHAPHEKWLGTTTVEQGAALVADADVIAIPSLAHSWSRAQLPAKVVDAMVAGRFVVASDTPPLRWALGDTGVLVPPGDVDALTSALRDALSPQERTRHGLAARERAEQLFSVGALTPRWDRFLSRAAGIGTAREPAGKLVVAMATYRRPELLAELLPELVRQCAAVDIEADILVVDNDPDGEARELVTSFEGVRYVHEPRPGISAARNAALEAAAGDDLLVFIDDDEMPTDEHWLARMLQTWRAHPDATGVVGPVISTFDAPVPSYVRSGDFFHRRRLPTGSPIKVAATNNLLLDLRHVRDHGLRFDEEFGLSGGSDTLFSAHLVQSGGTMVWCDEAVVLDKVPAKRATADWVLRRAVRSGNSRVRVDLHLTEGRGRIAVRAKALAVGSARIGAGGVRHVGGRVLRSEEQRAKGSRTVARGLGMIGGAVGYVYQEYRRPTG